MVHGWVLVLTVDLGQWLMDVPQTILIVVFPKQIFVILFIRAMEPRFNSKKDF
jgi:hypothetical protein